MLLRLRGVQAARVQERSRELGQGMAGFAKGPITDQGKAISFVHEVGRHMGLSADDIGKVTSRIEFGLKPSSSFNGRRVLHLSSSIGKPLFKEGPYNELRAFLEVAHELNHALVYHRYIEAGGNSGKFWESRFNATRAIDPKGRTRNYYVDEINVEGAAAELTSSVSTQAIQALEASGRFNAAGDTRRLLAEALSESDEYISSIKKVLGQ